VTSASDRGEAELTVVIPTFNNEAILARTLESWRTHASPLNVEILVVEDGCRDGTAAYLAAIQIGPLAVAAVLSALYPAMTVLLAAVVLRERLTRVHALGLAAAALAVVLIAGGQG